MPITQEDREGLRDLILWYRDKYYKASPDDYDIYDPLINTAMNGDENEFRLVEVIVDGWLDY